MRHIPKPGPLRTALFSFLLLASSAILFTTYQNTESARSMADQALEGTGLALASTVEAELRSGDPLSSAHVRRILSDRVIAYAVIADKTGRVLFHSNPALTGTDLREPGLAAWLETGQAYGRRITLGTGLPAFEFNYLLHLPDGRAELLRLVLQTFQADQILAKARRMWGTVGLVLLTLWTMGILFDRLFAGQVRLQEAFRKREQLAVIGQMTATLAHEIRNALGGIKGYTQWVEEKMEAGDPKKTGLALVLKGVGRIEFLVEDLLLFARKESYHLTPLPLNQLIQEAVDSEISPERARIEFQIEPEVRVLADKEKLHQVLLNGLQNAFQAMEAETEPLLLIRAEGRGKWITLRMEDRGPGISEEDRAKIFTPFFTTKTTGTGLGLAYSRKVIEGMGGTIALDNREGGRGAVLTIKLLRAERTVSWPAAF
jgi:two-component system, NtrC family, sensor histidine kinase HydH